MVLKREIPTDEFNADFTFSTGLNNDPLLLNDTLTLKNNGNVRIYNDL